MSLYDTRRDRLEELIHARFGGKQAAFADKMDLSPNYVSRMLSAGKHRKNIGEDTAREIEKKLKLPKYSLDGESSNEQGGMDKQTFHGIHVSLEGAIVGAEWEKLDEPFRTQIQQMIESMVAQQVRDHRPTRKSQKDEKRSSEG